MGCLAQKPAPRGGAPPVGSYKSVQELEEKTQNQSMASLSSIRELLPSFSETGAPVECPGCGGSLEVTADRCPDCGIDVTVECRDCGSALETETHHCPNCGGTEYEVFRLE